MAVKKISELPSSTYKAGLLIPAVDQSLALANQNVSIAASSLAGVSGPTGPTGPTGPSGAASSVGTLIASSGTTTITPGSYSEIIITCNAASTYNIGNGTTDRQKLMLVFVQGNANSGVTLGTGFAFGTNITSASFVSSTASGKSDYLGLEWSSSASAWRVLAYAGGY